MAFAPNRVQFGPIAEFKAMTGAGCHAGRLQALIDPVHAIIAFDHLAGFLVPLGGAPGAGGNTGFASHAQVLIHKYDAVFTALLHSPGRAGGHAPRILAMEARHKNVGAPRLLPDQTGAHFDHLAQPGA